MSYTDVYFFEKFGMKKDLRSQFISVEFFCLLRARFGFELLSHCQLTYSRALSQYFQWLDPSPGHPSHCGPLFYFSQPNDKPQLKFSLPQPTLEVGHQTYPWLYSVRSLHSFSILMIFSEIVEAPCQNGVGACMVWLTLIKTLE